MKMDLTHQENKRHLENLTIGQAVTNLLITQKVTKLRLHHFAVKQHLVRRSCVCVFGPFRRLKFKMTTGQRISMSNNFVCIHRRNLCDTSN